MLACRVFDHRHPAESGAPFSARNLMYAALKLCDTTASRSSCPEVLRSSHHTLDGRLASANSACSSGSSDGAVESFVFDSSSQVRLLSSRIAASKRIARWLVRTYLRSHSPRSRAASRSSVSARPTESSRDAAEMNSGTNASARALPGSVWNNRMSSGVTEESSLNSLLMRIARHGEYQSDPMYAGF